MNDQTVCNCRAIVNAKEAQANARLIAAAPALYAAGRTILNELDSRIQAASDDGQPVPVFNGIADLHAALALVESEDAGA